MNKNVLVACNGILLLAGCSTAINVDAKTGTAQPGADRIEANKALARVWFDKVINQRNLDAIANTYAVGYIHHGPEGADMHDLKTVRAFAAAILAASNDRQTVVEQQVAEGNLVVTRFTSRGHHTGLFQGLEPTGKIWTTEGICISRVENGKIAEDWEIVHQSGL